MSHVKYNSMQDKKNKTDLMPKKTIVAEVTAHLNSIFIHKN